MKITNKISIAVLSMGVLACSKDVSVEKNITNDWQVDQAVTNSDIRTFTGYDPRYDWAIIQKKVEEIPMVSFSTLNIVEKNERTINVDFLKPLAKQATISLEYDTALFEKVKAEYDGFELGDASLVEMIEGEKDVAVGDSSVKFKIATNNQSTFSKKVLIPFSLKVKQGDLKLVTDYSYFLVKIVPEQVKAEVTLTPTQILGSISYGVPSLATTSGGVSIALSRAIPTQFSVGLERDDAIAPEGSQVIQRGIEGTSLAPTNFQGRNQGQLTYRLQALNSDTALGNYVLPLKLVITDAAGQKHEFPNGNVIIPIVIREVTNLTFSEDATIDYRWKAIPKSTITSPGGSNAFNGIEDNINDYVYSKADFRINFNQPRSVKSMLIRSLSNRYGINYRMREFTVYSIKDGKENFEGKVTFEKKENNDIYLIKFTRTLSNINGLILKEIKVNREENSYLISEIDIYE